MKNYLVILAGSPRGGERTWKSLNKYVLQPLDADLAICCSDKWDQNISLFELAKYKWVFKEFDDYSIYYEKNFLGSWKQYFNTGIKTGLYESGLLHFVFKDMIKRQYLEVLKNYKYIIFTRFDQLYVDYHPEFKGNQIWIPDGEEYSGVCDRHAVFPSNFSEKFFGICDYVDSEEALKEAPEFNNCETTYLNHLKNVGLDNKIVIFDRIQFTASLKNEHTNWRTAKYNIYLTKSLMMKYPGEFMLSMSNMIKKYNIINTLLKEPIYFLNYLYLKIRIKGGKYKKMITA
jgi:hypothetical protein